MIEVKDLHKGFGDVQVLKGISTTFHPGKTNLIIGQSGAGKTVFLKTLIFAFLIATVPSYHGYYVKGGSIAVGRASTQSVVWTTILIVIANYLLTQMLLT